MEISSIGQVAITIQDLPRAVAFYRDILGLKLLFEVSGMAFFDVGGIRLMLTTPENPEATYSSILYYKTPDILATATALEAKGVILESKPHMIAKMPDHELWMAFLRDCEGNLLALMSEVR
jgi:methylmalonyl-CoA/ethylmalonyl-CoA epimerase